jgi:hypothetical protein
MVELPRRIVLVLGMHRSGTSLCANILNVLGCDMADGPGAGPANARGHFERPAINDFHDRVLAALGRKWYDARHHLAFPEHWWAEPAVRAVRDEMVAWLRPRLAASPRFGLKDPRAARLLPMWREIFDALGAEPTYVFCVRDPAEVARSVAARDRFSAEESEYRWVVYNAAAAGGLGERPVCILPYEDWFSRPDPTLRRLAAHLGWLGEVPDGVTGSVIDPTLRHDGATVATRPLTRRLYGLILAGAAEGRLGPEVRELAQALGGFERLALPLMEEVATLRASVAEQNRVIGDLNEVIRRMRQAA